MYFRQHWFFFFDNLKQKDMARNRVLLKYIQFFCFAISIICVLFIFSLLLQRSWMSDVTYLKINLYLRMFHPLSTTGLIPVLVLLILNVRITRGIIKLQVGTQNQPTMHHIYVLQYHTVTPPNFRVCAWQKVLAKCLKICYN